MKFFADLNKIDDIKFFVKQAERYDCDIIVKNKDRVFSVDGTSIIGLFSLNLSEPVEVIINNEEAAESLQKEICRLLV